MNHLPQIELKTATKSQIEELAKDYFERTFESGEFNELEALGAITRLKLLVETIEKKAKDYAIDELEKYGKGTHEIKGISFNVSERETLNYKEDSEIKRLESEIKERKALIKQATKLEVTMFHSDSGEKIEPVTRTYTTVLKKSVL